MLGAVLGDIIGSYYEWHNVKTKEFPLVTTGTKYTDDTVMTLAVAKWLMEISCISQQALCFYAFGISQGADNGQDRKSIWLRSK